MNTDFKLWFHGLNGKEKKRKIHILRRVVRLLAFPLLWDPELETFHEYLFTDRDES
jgi:hypothetical protein